MVTRLRSPAASLAALIVAACTGARPLPIAKEAATEALTCPAGTAMIPGGDFRTKRCEDVNVVGPFCLDLTEVTAGRYAECVRAGACRDDKLRFSSVATYGAPDLARHPINYVSWDESGEFCAWVGKRLPTSTEWEWAARGAGVAWRPPAKANDFPGCFRARQRDWRSTGLITCPVATYPQGDTPQGVHDLAGNVSEWIGDFHHRKYHPRGYRGSHGGGGEDSVFLITQDASERAPDVGFRCALNPTRRTRPAASVGP